MTTFVILLKGNPLEHSLLAVAIIACQALYIAFDPLKLLDMGPWDRPNASSPNAMP